MNPFLVQINPFQTFRPLSVQDKVIILLKKLLSHPGSRFSRGISRGRKLFNFMNGSKFKR